MQNPVTCNLKRWLAERDMSQRTLAMRVNQDVSAITRYASGERVPTLYVARKIARILQTSTVAIWPDKEVP